MQILRVKLIYWWYNKAVTDLQWMDRNYNMAVVIWFFFSLGGIQDCFIASKNNWLLETIIKKIQIEFNTRSYWFEDLNVPFGKGNNNKTAAKLSTRWMKDKMNMIC